MAFRESPLGELKVPLTWTAAVAVVVAAVIAIGLLLADRRETLQEDAYGAARKTVDTVAAPVSGAIAAPGRWTGEGLNWISSYFFVASENRRLQKELSEMRRWRDTAIALKDQNERFQALLGLKLNPPIPMVAARVVADSRGPFANARIADAGSARGVMVGNPAMSDRGLIGRVVGVTANASRILLLTDIASRTPVMIDRTNARSILTGDGGPNPKLEYLRQPDLVREGDLIITSGDGGVLPRGLPVGVAVKDITGRWRVSLSADQGSIDYVQILKFVDFSQLADEQELSTIRMPPATNQTERGTILGPAPSAPRQSPVLKAPAPKAPPQKTASPPPAATQPPAAEPSPAAIEPQAPTETPSP